MSKYRYLVVRKSLSGIVLYKATKFNFAWTRFPDLAYAYSLEGAKSVVKRLNSRSTGLFQYSFEQALLF